jgi:hypothetical protein
MAFPLAHPAAALAFRRWCPRYLDFSALVVGCLVPDLAASIDWEYFSHTILGSFVFCLPVGLVTLWIVRQICGPLLSTLPNPHRDALLPFRSMAPCSFVRIIGSLVLGSWLHIGWDMFTHEHSWLVRHSVLSSVSVAGLQLNRLVWFFSSIIGVAILFVQYLSLLRGRNARTISLSGSDGRAYVFWLGMLLFPFLGAVPLTLHDPNYYHGAFVPYVAVYYFSCCYLTLAGTGFLLKYQQRRHGTYVSPCHDLHRNSQLVVGVSKTSPLREYRTDLLQEALQKGPDNPTSLPSGHGIPEAKQ